MQKILRLLLVVIVCVGCQSSTAKKEVSKSITDKREQKSSNKILFVVSNQKTYGDTSLKTSNHFGEIVYAYDVLANAGYTIDFVSPKGGEVALGYIDKANKVQQKYLENSDFLEKLKTTKTPSEVNFSNYKAIYYVGGGAAMFGVPENKEIQDLAINIYEKNNGIVSAICHGTAGIVNLKTTNGKYLYENKEVNGFPDLFERTDREYYKTFPFSIEKIIEKRGGRFSYSKEGWDNYYKVDGRLITGQDPTAAASVAKEIVKVLNELDK
ncbi:type 1 glutamine amidotransferase domain-containing protein [Tenacibaculum holothuriorum]|uniref:type 1 glutamine amidotransferase domain-containing protein n=1 Tax=Tenacibaculum holothuriorum TaxID=1635173 RepID=UPI000A321F78|nr:type 1 glutamine amidotransferase domain-containing protein [Tenacibaculum holothuriorum]